jgi:catechol 2,3-dioxygenase-like lactoylglutathione lyase family enzyme
MIDHLTLVVSDFERSKAFYLAALEPLGYTAVMELTREQIPSLPFPATVGLGVGGKPDLWLRPADGSVTPTHVALSAPDRAAVDAFYQAAIAAGATDNGAPGLRPHYHANYYGAFVLDPDGYNLEAVCHAPPAAG